MAKIIQAAMPVMGFGVHNYLALVDNSGNVVRELHGVARDGNGNLASWTTTGTLFATNSVSWNTFSTDAKHELASGTMTQMSQLFSAGEACATSITEKAVTYGVLAGGNSYNSNSAFISMAACMGLDTKVADMPGYEPGVDKHVLTQSEINAIRDLFRFDLPVPTWPEPSSGNAAPIADTSVTLVGVSDVHAAATC
ncbi:hypothetical protein [Pseudoduganella sp.]|uniref:hypothetical protein n=1 Tax=Pseudoduganella sp. TaxID=1880898 RepID=UPI0035B25A46